MRRWMLPLTLPNSTMSDIVMLLLVVLIINAPALMNNVVITMLRGDHMLRR